MATGRTPDVFHGQFCPDSVGLWTFRVDGWGDPIATWRKAVTAKLDAGQSETELSNDLIVGARLLERAATGVPRKLRDPLIEAAETAAQAGRPVHPCRRGAVRRGQRAARAVSAARPDHPRRAVRRLGGPAARPASAPGTSCFRGPPAAGTRRATRFTARSPPPPRRCRASPGWASTWCTCRRSTRSARCTARVATTRSPPHRRTSDRRGPSAATRAATTPCIPSWARSRTSTTSSPRRAIRAWRWRWIWRCRPRRTIPGPRRIPNGSRCCPTAPSPMRRIRRRSTRTSIRSTSTTTPRASTTRCCGWCGTGSATASRSSASTTRTPSRRTSGRG